MDALLDLEGGGQAEGVCIMIALTDNQLAKARSRSRSATPPRSSNGAVALAMPMSTTLRSVRCTVSSSSNRRRTIN